MKTLQELFDEHGGNGVVRIDLGSGSAGPCWIDSGDIDGDIAMHPVAGDDCAYEDDIYIQDNEDTYQDVIRYIIPGYIAEDGVYVSDWIIDGQGDNPYRYRYVF